MSGVGSEQRQHEAKELARIRRQVAAVQHDQWLLTDTGDGMIVQARAPDGELFAFARFDKGASPEEMELLALAPVHMGFLLGMLDRAIEKIRQLRPADAGTSGQGRAGEAGQDSAGSRRAKDYTTEAAMICQRGDFRRFLADLHGLEEPLTYDRATQRLRSVLRIKSRTELNEDDDAAARWKQLRAAFETWKRG